MTILSKARQYRSYPTYVKDSSLDVEGQIRNHLRGRYYVGSLCCDNNWCIATDADYFELICSDLAPTICSFHLLTKLQQELVLSDWRVNVTRYSLKNDIVNGSPMQMCAKRLWLSLGLNPGEYDRTAGIVASFSHQDGSKGSRSPMAVLSGSEHLAIKGGDAGATTENHEFAIPENTAQNGYAVAENTAQNGDDKEINAENAVGATKSVAHSNLVNPIGHAAFSHLPYDSKSSSDVESQLPIFQALHNYLTLRCDQDDETQKLLQDYHGKILRSKLTYKGDWRFGRIQEWILKTIEPGWLLLLCLDPYTFFRGDKQVLAVIYQDFDMQTAVAEAVEEWGLLELYPKIASKTAKPGHPKVFKCIIFVVRVFFALKHLGGDKDSLAGGFRDVVCPVLSIIENGLTDDKKRKRANTRIRGNSEPPAKKKMTGRPAKKSRKNSAEGSGGVASKVGGHSNRLPTVNVAPTDTTTMMPLDVLANGECALAQPVVPHDGQAETTPNVSVATAEHAGDVNPATSIAPPEGYNRIKASTQREIDLHLSGAGELQKMTGRPAKKSRKNIAKDSGGVASKVGGRSNRLPTANIVPPDATPLMPLDPLANGECALAQPVAPHDGQAETAPNVSVATAEHAGNANPPTSIAPPEGYDRIKASIQREIGLHLTGAGELRKQADDLRKQADDRTKQADDRTQQAHDLLKSLEDLEALKQDDRDKEKCIEAKVRRDIMGVLGWPTL